MSHLETDECGAPEFFSNGTKVLLASGDDGKINLEAVEHLVLKRSDIHYPKPRVLSVTQATELGTVYSVDELRAIGELARKLSLRFHMDGSRFANAVASLGVSPKEITWQAGVDVLCFGGAGLFAAGIIGRQAIAALAWIALILIAATGVIGAYQAGVEWKFLPGPTSCTGARFEFHGAADLVNAAPVVRCDEASWRLFGISLAGYNAVFSLGAAGLGAYLLSIKKTFLLRRRR